VEIVYVTPKTMKSPIRTPKNTTIEVNSVV